MWLVYLLLMFFVISFYYYYTKDFFYPGIVFLGIWFFTCSISCIDMDDFMQPWCLEMYFVTILSGLAFFIGTLFYIRKVSVRSFSSKIEISFTYTFLIRLLFLICFSCYILEWIRGGSLIAITLDPSMGDIKSEASEGDIAGIHYGTVFLPYLAILIFFRLLNSINMSRLDIFMILLILCTSLILKVSRGDILILIFSFLFLYSRYHKINFKMLVFISIVVLFILIGVMFMRVSDTSIVMTTTTNPMVSVLYSYIATSFANLNDYILANHPYHLCGNATFSPLWTLLGIKGDMKIIETQQLDVFNACTYLYGFYHDFKIIGIIVFPFLLGLALSMSYYNVIYGSSYWILLLAVLQKAIYTPFFGNYFTGEFILFFPYMLVTFIIMFVLHYKITLTKIKC